MGAVLEVAERAWRGDIGEMNVHPGLVYVGLEELEEGLAFMSAFSNAAVIRTAEGLVLIDVSGPFHAASLFGAVREWSAEHVSQAIYTHGHVDHVSGLHPFEEEAVQKGWARTEVVAHAACVARFDRYRLTHGYNAVINQRQFGFPAPIFPTEFRYPDRVLDGDAVLEVGGERLEIHHDRGETDDHLWVWLPERGTLYTGDLFIWASPNCGNPQKVQRYPREWAAALRKMAAKGAARLLPGHGPPIVGAARVRQALEETATLLETVVEQTLALMNEGARLNDILHAVELPEDLLRRPYLRPIYDEPIFIVRNVWRLYGGWYDGNPAHLKPAPDAAVGRSLAEAAGGAAALAGRAQAVAASGDLALACHLVELAWHADASDPAVRAARAEIYQRRADGETSLMARAIYQAAARESAAPPES